MRYTLTTLKKLEALFGALDYTIRYEKGNFHSGYCIVEDRKIAVLNKFFDTEARINCLLDILNNLNIAPEDMPAIGRDLYEKWLKAKQEGTEESE
ncbi:MAG: hypothetical protein IPL65_06185 [Lewinellaceae bacterium]|nr:hypothetical protein [Lewinellaceae bacterium]